MFFIFELMNQGSDRLYVIRYKKTFSNLKLVFLHSGHSLPEEAMPGPNFNPYLMQRLASAVSIISRQFSHIYRCLFLREDSCHRQNSDVGKRHPKAQRICCVLLIPKILYFLDANLAWFV